MWRLTCPFACAGAKIYSRNLRSLLFTLLRGLQYTIKPSKVEKRAVLPHLWGRFPPSISSDIVLIQVMSTSIDVRSRHLDISSQTSG